MSKYVTSTTIYNNVYFYTFKSKNVTEAINNANKKHNALCLNYNYIKYYCTGIKV